LASRSFVTCHSANPTPLPAQGFEDLSFSRDKIGPKKIQIFDFGLD
jgi:hypothetical protein